MHSRSIARWSPIAALLALSVLIVSCGGGGDGSTVTPEEGSISLSVSPTSGTVQQGNSLQATGTLTRAGSFTGNVTFAVTGNNLPTGITGSATNLVTTGAVTTATITIATTAAVPAGSYQITVAGSGSGVTSSSVTFTLTVTAIPVGTYSLSLNPGGLSITQGATGSTILSINRSNFPGAVTLAVEGLPNGVTASFNPVSPVAADNTTLTLTVASNAAAAPSTITIRGSTPGQLVQGTANLLTDQVVTLQLTVTVAGDYTLSALPTSLNFGQSSGGTSAISINRTGGFTGSIALAVTGAPLNMTATVAPTPNNTNAATLTVTTTGAVVAGNYTLTITGTFPGLINHTATVALTVVNSTVKVDFSACTGTLIPVWFAGINGSTTTKITPVNNVYTFQMSETTGGYAYVLAGNSGTASTEVRYQTRAELTAGTINVCSAASGSTRTVTGTIAGFGPASSPQVNVTLGGTWSFGDYSPGTSGTAIVNSTTPAFSLQNAATGASDLVAWRTASTGPTTDDRGLFMRAINPVNNSSVGALDLAGAGSFPAAIATATINGLQGGGDTQSLTMDYFTGTECTPSRLNRMNVGNASVPIFGVPAANQLPTDFHALSMFTLSASLPRRIRYYSTWFHTLANRVIEVPPVFLGGVSLLPAGYRVPLASGPIPDAYVGGGARLFYSGTIQGVGFISYNITASGAWIGGNNLSLALPDFTGQGYLSAWAIALTDPSTYQLNIYNDVNLGARKCQEGFTVAVASLLGNN